MEDEDDHAVAVVACGARNVGGSMEMRTFERGGSADGGVRLSRLRLLIPSIALMLNTGVAGS